jgi:hypothetical protein
VGAEISQEGLLFAPAKIHAGMHSAEMTSSLRSSIP